MPASYQAGPVSAAGQTGVLLAMFARGGKQRVISKIGGRERKWAREAICYSPLAHMERLVVAELLFMGAVL
ncbi:hypothetical protein [Arthrobacter globiformis]|uniref:hypothetical protein n=1 Tax=Arthrobacter globiformis TaxID=1665 RepID=UPI0011B94105|nr:hypothetical protein [Arthrobacter globiformis]